MSQEHAIMPLDLYDAVVAADLCHARFRITEFGPVLLDDTHTGTLHAYQRETGERLLAWFRSQVNEDARIDLDEMILRLDRLRFPIVVQA